MQTMPSLLVVDDDPDILTTLSIHLGADGYRVLRAAGGKEALALLDEELPALAIIDLMMPGMDGFETSRRIKQRADIPILMLTAVDAEETKVQAIERYADDYMTKPFSHAELTARVGRIVRRAWPGINSGSAHHFESVEPVVPGKSGNAPQDAQGLDGARRRRRPHVLHVPAELLKDA